jgi:CRISPR-associated protein Cas2
MTLVRYLVTYDIADDDRRDDIALYLSAHGPRVQLSVFEVALPDRDAAAQFRQTLRTLLDPDEDQIRLYPLDHTAWTNTLIYGTRTIEERRDYWIL